MNQSRPADIVSFRNELSQLVNYHLENGTPPHKIVDAMESQVSVAKVRGQTEGYINNRYSRY